MATVSETNPIVWLVPVRRLRETMFGRYPISRAACRTRASTSSEIRISLRRPESTNEAAVWETPALPGDVGKRDPLRTHPYATSALRIA